MDFGEASKEWKRGLSISVPPNILTVMRGFLYSSSLYAALQNISTNQMRRKTEGLISCLLQLDDVVEYKDNRNVLPRPQHELVALRINTKNTLLLLYL